MASKSLEGVDQNLRRIALSLQYHLYDQSCIALIQLSLVALNIVQERVSLDLLRKSQGLYFL